ncbi:uncharacterized protein MYCGRDRAFT_90665 [Zymoseptoria tritici IPO323]|uniref:Mg2+ transporter protein, CorA-like/Zinc transport protein ZntB n=1 Tax=Zymoseptoria tritici (strain CBS 115943 / IPO323) TaxID=336722 RepID=F9X4C8_ZYMTI|nr:uncharacterized protein MYCGRDRAFT_90665 [Zymoseptoria tritici IPO323]EGP90590.1 hypothetical protein MYCGRDRAFT_90665 [Zymoseptoria tritici IPO323]
MAELQKWEISDSRLEIDRSYDDSTVRFKLLIGNSTSANLKDTQNVPFDSEVIKTITDQGWISDEYTHLWRRDEGGSAALTSHGILNSERRPVFLLLVTRQSRAKLLRRIVPRDFAILPFCILKHHVDETLVAVQELTRLITSAERRIAEGVISLDDNGDYKLINRLNLEHVRLQRRSDFQNDLGSNLLKYLDAYQRLWSVLFEGGTGYIEDMREKVEQQMRYSTQVQKDLEMLPRRIDNQSKAMFSIVALRDNKLNIQLAESSRRIAEESRLDNLLNVKLAKATAQLAEETRQDSAAMKTIAVLTLTFLPGTAVASFFGMDGMFNWNPGPGEKLASPYIWIFFVVTIPLTILVYFAWWFWFRKTREEFQKQFAGSDIATAEEEMMRRMRTTTNSWTLEKQTTMTARQ